MKDEIGVYIILASLIFGFNLAEVKNTITTEVTEAVKDSSTGNVSDQNIFKRFL
ncbi:MAG: hypothetical protein PF440_10130 [Thiomicrorhabdus sp.]|jgi:hypothetical protein|nr:hypothetical protein [Thiomicrorhabdus sp.]